MDRRITNPFAPGAGTTPPALTGRDEILSNATIALKRVKQGRAEKSIMLTGLRGVGKTVLLNQIKTDAEKEGYEVIFVETQEERQKTSLASLLGPGMRSMLLAMTSTPFLQKAKIAATGFFEKHKLELGVAGFSFGVESRGGIADSGDLAVDLSELFTHTAKAAQDNETAIALIIDEMQYLDEKELSALIMAAHKLAQENLPMLLVGAGLPQLVGAMGNAKSYAERLFTFNDIDALDEDSARAALTEPVKADGVSFAPNALKYILAQSHCYPYFLQEWGYHTWNVATGRAISLSDAERATQNAIERLDKDFFRVRFDRLTPTEKQYAFAMAELGDAPYRSGDIAARLNKGVQNVATFRSSLIKKGMVYAPAHGDNDFTVPLFSEFLRRQKSPQESLPLA